MHFLVPVFRPAPDPASTSSATTPAPQGTPPPSRPACIRLRGIRQHNLKGFDLDLPLGKFIVVTGLSGAGKSSLVFDTLHAEGQRRYVETFSAYTRQFLDLLDQPKVDAVENIRPSIAIEQTNTVKTSRSTVGTMTELTDFFKVWFSQVARCYDPATGELVEDDHPASIWAKALARSPAATVILAFRIQRPANLAWPELLAPLRGQSYTRILIPGTPPPATPSSARAPAALTLRRLDDPAPLPDALDHLYVAQDRLVLEPAQRGRFLEAAETALHFGQGQLFLFDANTLTELGHYSRGLHSPKTGRTFRPATPALFSFNSPLGACPQCKGFGRIIEIDPRLALPDHSLSLADGVIKPWESESYGASKTDMLSAARRAKIPTHVPFAQLTPAQRAWVLDGEPGYGTEGREWPEAWYGVKGFFTWLEKNTYKTHVRVFLSRYRSYLPCPACAGARLQPESLCWRWRGYTLAELYQLPVARLHALLDTEHAEHASPAAPAHPAGPASSAAPADARSTSLALDSILTRLRYLAQVGLGYLTLDRTSRTLSGGEVQRVNLTSCLGTSLVDTLFVLDEPSVGLHPRDLDRLIDIIRTLTAAGNTVVVVEHDEAMIRAADQVLEIGPEPGARGGHLVFQGDQDELLHSPASLTGRYLSGRLTIEAPAHRRPVPPPPTGIEAAPGWLSFHRASKHNLRELTVHLPLHRLVALSGVSGSGKSTLLDHVIHQGLLAKRGQLTDDPAALAALTGDEALGEIVLVDQSPLTRTPRSNPALYTEAWDLIRELYARSPAARELGFSSSSFSFNSGDGRCPQCLGLGYERVEMQFLSDVFVPCPVCEGRRFLPAVLAITWEGKSVADLLATSVCDALPLFHAHPAIHHRLATLDAVGLGYLTLGQPLNTLSGGESQRLKLVKYLADFAPAADPDANPNTAVNSPAAASTVAPAGPRGALLLLDEPTTGLHRHDVRRLLAVLQALVERGHSVVVIEHNLDVLKSADWILEIGPEAGADGGRLIAQGTPEQLAFAPTATAPFLRAALDPARHQAAYALSAQALAAEPARPPAPLDRLTLTGARENNLKNISVSIAHRQLTVVTGVSGSGKSTLAFDIIFAEGQRRFMESMSPYARQFVEQLARPDLDQLTGIPPTVAIEQRITRGSRKSTVATITEVAQYLRLLYARLGVQYHPETGRPVQPLSPAQLRRLLTTTLATPRAQKARHLYLCAPLVRGRKGHHQPIADWLDDHGYALMRADGDVIRVDTFQKLDRYAEHDIEAVIADLKTDLRATAARVAAEAAARARLSQPDPRITIKTSTTLRAAAAAKAAAKLAANLPPASVEEALDRALALGKGSCFLTTAGGDILAWFSTTRTDLETGESFPELEPKHFSHNSPRGWCPTCRGHGRVFPWMLVPAEEAAEEEAEDPAARLRALGIESAEDLADTGTPCPDCHGQRLNRIARAVRLPLRGRLAPLTLPELLARTPAQLLNALGALDLDERGQLITRDILPQIEERLKFLDHVGLSYLTLDRPTDTLSGGEAQRIRLAAQLGTNLAGVLYVLDEPSIGLHARDNDRLIDTLLALRDKGNTLLVVEHDDELMARADYIIDLGPAAGRHGGQVLAQGTPTEIRAHPESLTGHYLARGIAHPLRGTYRPLPRKPGQAGILKKTAPSTTRATKTTARAIAPTTTSAMPPAAPESEGWLTLSQVRFRNLAGFTLQLPLGRLVMVAGPSGAGKSTLFRDVLRPAVAHAIKTRDGHLTGAEFVEATGFVTDDARPAAQPPFGELLNAHHFKQVIEVDQSPIGKTPRSTPATYLGIFDLIRTFFAALPESKVRGLTAGRFSFNTAGGRCETCAGGGRIKLEMAFMPETYLPCDDCRGLRYSPELAELTWKGRSIGQVLQLTFEEAVTYFDFHSQLKQVCQLMVDCGLGYLTLGQSSPTLSGGEAQRLKLVTELAQGLASYRERSRGQQPHNLYLLEEPTIGLHLSDCEKLIHVLHALVDQGHSVVVIEHHLDLLAEADYILELGPGGGPGGGQLLYQGTLPGLHKLATSPTGPYLRARLRPTAVHTAISTA